MNLLSVTANLRHDLARLNFTAPITHVYNPLEYAAEPYRQYVERYANEPEILFIGMNPGPWGMVQTGVPFGDVEMVRDWLRIHGPVGRPPLEHPKRPVLGFSCRRGEASGRRLWGWARDRFGAPEFFFCALLRGQLLSAVLFSRRRYQFDTGQIAGRTAAGIVRGMRRRPAAYRGMSATPPCIWGGPFRRATHGRGPGGIRCPSGRSAPSQPRQSVGEPRVDYATGGSTGEAGHRLAGLAPAIVDAGSGFFAA